MDAKLAAALVAAQNDLRAIGKDAVNPHFKNRYASLDAIVESVRPILASHGLAIVQGANDVRAGVALEVWTQLVHESGETMMSSVYVPLAKQDAQGAGGALTYGRRYGLSAILCLATDEDDDGNAASKPAKQKPARAEPPPPPEERGSYPPVPKWLGLAAERPMPFGNTKGKSLKDHSTKHLLSIEKWCLAPERKDHFALLTHDIKVVLADRSLESEDAKVKRMREEVEAPDGLGF